MSMTQHQRWLAGALCAALAACSSMDKNPGTASSDGGSASANNMTGTASSPGAASGAMNSASTSSAASSSTTQTSYGIVQSIDTMQRQDVSAGAIGAAAVGGSMGAPNDRVYRVSVRMDDGTTQMVVVDNKPEYKTGDRVRYNNGMLEKY